ncbi:MAG: GntR family transcriptional regulator [Eubacteriales bacterium]|nr:GntR family transcriptional regulator [Eubacteriales bacterium]
MILLDYKDSRPIYEQVAEKLQDLMLHGILEEDGQMPSVRSLAMELSINPNTIQRAYGELERRGFIYMVKGRGSFVGSIRRIREAKREELAGRMAGLAKEAAGLEISCEEFVRMAEGGYLSCTRDQAGVREPAENNGEGENV